MSALDADIIIVGAGMTGLHTAAELERLSPQAKVLVLEASSKPGGRIRTQRIEGADGRQHPADLGAHYIARRHERLCALANRLAPGAFVRGALLVRGAYELPRAGSRNSGRA